MFGNSPEEISKLFQAINPHLSLKNVDSQDFVRYGVFLNAYDFCKVFTPFVDYVGTHTNIPETGNIYVASDTELEKLYQKEVKIIQNFFFGQMPIQVGYCNGKNTKLGALEFHKASEILVAVTDLCLLLADVRSCTRLYDAHNFIHSAKVEAFFVPAGTALELFATTLHFAPCAVRQEGFKAVVILPRGTNAELDVQDFIEDKDDSFLPLKKFLFKKNKWLLCHEDRSDLIEKGAYCGIFGENITVFPLAN